jgi:exonuclease VII large subunit
MTNLNPVNALRCCLLAAALFGAGAAASPHAVTPQALPVRLAAEAGVEMDGAAQEEMEAGLQAHLAAWLAQQETRLDLKMEAEFAEREALLDQKLEAKIEEREDQLGKNMEARFADREDELVKRMEAAFADRKEQLDTNMEAAFVEREEQLDKKMEKKIAEREAQLDKQMEALQWRLRDQQRLADTQFAAVSVRLNPGPGPPRGV